MPYFNGYRRAMQYAKRISGGAPVKYYPRKRSWPYRRQLSSRSYSRRRISVPTSFPEKQFAKLIYHDFYTLSSGGAATYAYQAWRGNSIYDPDPSAGGSAPSGYSNMARLFNFYDVKAASFRVQITNGGSAQNIDVGLVAIPYIDYANLVASIGSIQNITSEILVPAHRGKVCQLAGISNNNFTAAINKRSLSLFARTRGVLRLPHDSNELAVMGTNPGTQWYFVLWVASANSTSMSNTLTAEVTITYYTDFLQSNVMYFDA